MPFLRILKTLVDLTPQAIGAIVVDWEGESVQEFCHCDPYEIRFFGAHQEILFNSLKAVHNNVQLGMIEELVITATDNQLIIGCIDKDYALAMKVGRDCAVGVALHKFRAAIAELKKEI